MINIMKALRDEVMFPKNTELNPGKARMKPTSGSRQEPATLQSPQERCTRKIVQLALKVRFRLNHQKVP